MHERAKGNAKKAQERMEGSVGRIKKSRACAGFAPLVFRLYGLKLASYKTLILKPLG